MRQVLRPAVLPLLLHGPALLPCGGASHRLRLAAAGQRLLTTCTHTTALLSAQHKDNTITVTGATIMGRARLGRPHLIHSLQLYDFAFFMTST
jgi:hypothetical protein